MAFLPTYAAFLLANRLQEFVLENIQLSRQHQLPFLKQLQTLNKQELTDFFTLHVHSFLTDIVNGEALANTTANLEKWQTNQLPLFSREHIVADDWVMGYSIQKQIMIRLLPGFTHDIPTFTAIVLETEQLFSQLEKHALHAYFEVQNERMMQKNEELEKARQAQAEANAALETKIYQLQETHKELEDSQVLAHIGHWELDIQNENRVTWSSELYRIFGLPSFQSLTLELIAQSIHPDDYAALRQKILHSVTANVSYTHEYRISKSDQQQRIILSHGYPVVDTNGMVVKLKGVSQDITEQKQSNEELQRKHEELQLLNNVLQKTNEELRENQEEMQTLNEELREQIEQRIAVGVALRESESHFRLLADNSSDMISTHSPDGTFTYVSPACLDLLGYTGQELLGKQIYALFHPQDISQIQKIHTYVLEASQTQTISYRIQRKSGEYTWFESTIRSIRDLQTQQAGELQIASRDISWRKEIEDVLEREREYLRSILEHITDGIVACTEEGVPSFFNEAMLTFLGLPLNTLLSDETSFNHSLFHLDGITPLKREDIPLYKAFHGEEIRKVEIVIKAADGTRRNILCNGNQIRLAGGKIMGAVLIMHDITEQIMAQEEMRTLNLQLKESNEELVRTEELLKELNRDLEQKVAQRTLDLEAISHRFQFLADSVPQILWTTHTDGSVDYFNRNWYAYTGLSVADSLQWGWQLIIHPDDLEYCLQRWLHSVHTGEPYEIEYRLKRETDQNYRWHLGRGQAMKDENGNIVKWFGTCTDIHDRKLTEEELQEKNRSLELLNTVGTALSGELELDKVVQIVTDATTELTGAEFGAFFYNLINERGESYTLYTISGVPREAFSKFPLPRNTAIFAPTFYGVGIMRSDDITKDPRYGKSAPYYGMPAGHLPVRSYLAVPVISRNGQTIGGLFFGHSKPAMFQGKSEDLVQGIATQAAIAIDNSKLFLQIKDKNKELVRINSELDSFMYTASHDLKAPIANIQSFFNLLNKRLKGKLEEKERELFDMIDYSIAQFNRTIRDLTEITSVQNNVEEASTIVIAEVWEEVKSDLQQLINESGGRIQTRFEVDSLLIEKKNLRSILYNLVSNAIKYRSPHRSLQIDIQTKIHQHTFVFSVTDNGLGISTEQQPKLFSIFKRLHTHVEGSGIGLYIVKKIVENKGGRIEVESTEGQGTTFTVFLPL